MEPDDPAVGGERRRHAPPDALARRGRRRGGPEGRPRAPETLGEPDRRLQLLPRGQALALPEEVPLPDGQGVEPEGMGEPVHLALVREGGLGGAEAAEGRGGRVVGEDGHPVDLDVGDAVGTGGVDHAVEEGERREIGVRPGVRDQLDLEGGERPVPLGPVLVLHDERVALGGRKDRLLARVAETDGPGGLPDEEAEEDLDRHVLLPAEAAADVGGDEADARVREAEDVGDVAVVLDDLGGHAEGDDAVLVEPAHARLGLDEGVVDERGAVGILHDDVGLPEPLRHVAPADPPPGDHVPPRLEQGRVRAQRRLRVEDAGEVLILDVDEPGRLLRRLLGLRGDQGDRLAEVAHHGIGEDLRAGAERPDRRRLAGHVAEEDVVGDVPRRHDRAHARHRLRPARVDPEDPSGGPRGPRHPGVEHPRQGEVVRIAEQAVHLVAGVGPRGAGADDPVRGGPFAGRRGSGSPRRSGLGVHGGQASRPAAVAAATAAADRAASTILW